MQTVLSCFSRGVVPLVSRTDKIVARQTDSAFGVSAVCLEVELGIRETPALTSFPISVIAGFQNRRALSSTSFAPRERSLYERRTFPSIPGPSLERSSET